MKISLIAVGKRVPDWVHTGFEQYRKRLPRGFNLTLTPIAPGDRSGGDIKRAIEDEDRRMIRAIPDSAQPVALDENGRTLSTKSLATHLESWQLDGCDCALLIGGPDGLGPESRSRAKMSWSLSACTLPHALVRVIVAEQIYRAHTLLAGHPYHRE